MLAGRVPFEGDSSVAIAMQHVSDEPPPLRSLAPDVPESLALVVAHAMLKEPGAALRQRRRVLGRPRPRPARPRARRRDGRADRRSSPREPTELVPAVEATRIAPRPERRPRSLLAARSCRRGRRRASARAGRGCSSCSCCWRSARSRLRARRRSRRRVVDDDGTASRRPRRRRRPPSPRTRSTTSRARRTSEASSTLQRLRARPHDPERTARARRHARGRHRRRERPGRGCACCTDGDTVRLKVSRGQKDIPNIVDTTQADARAKLGPDFRSRRCPRRATRSTRATSRARTRPSAQRVPVGSPVTVYISTGPPRSRCRSSSARPRARRARRSTAPG